MKTLEGYTITENMAAVQFPSNALRSKIFKKPNGCLLKDALRQEVDLFIPRKFLIIIWSCVIFMQ